MTKGFIEISRVRAELEYWNKSLETYSKQDNVMPAVYLEAHTRVKVLSWVLGIELEN